MQETPKMLNIFGIGHSTVLAVVLILLFGALLVRTRVEGTGWWRVFLKGGREDCTSSS